MSRAGLVLIALVALPVPGRAEPDREAAPRGFDHVGHEGRVYAAGQDPPPCAACHPSDRQGRLGPAPGHDDCFGDCHGPPPSRRGVGARPGDRAAICAACHAAGSLARPGRIRVDYPPYRRAPDFAIALSHRRHDAVAACAACHTPDRERARDHAACARCHDRAEPTMASCEGCHQRAFGPARGPHSAASRYPVTGRFDHRRHERHLEARERPCLTCHAAVASTEGDQIPRPTMTLCEPCHDGATAFATVATGCRRCHSRPDQPPPDPLPRGLRAFDHAAHGELAMQCATCHDLAPDGRALPAGRGHQPCASAECHADDFRAPAPVTCGVCHVGVEPWRPLHRHLPPPSGALAVQFSHAAHLGGDAPRAAVACRACHRRDDSNVSLAPRGGHALCDDASCHPRDGDGDGDEPALGDCDGCHRPAGPRALGPWSVAARFRHTGHLRGADGEAIACEQCHAELGDGQRMPPPPKSSCAACHDGRSAFKMTGHGCQRCHDAD